MPGALPREWSGEGSLSSLRCAGRGLGGAPGPRECRYHPTLGVGAGPRSCVILSFPSQADIFKAFAELFQAATAKPAPLGVCDYPSSRAVYAIDLMLKWEHSPPPNSKRTRNFFS